MNADAGVLGGFLRMLLRTVPKHLAAAVALSLAAAGTEAAAVLLLVLLLRAVGLDAGEGGFGGLGDFADRLLGTLGVAPTLGPVLVAYVAVVGFDALLQRNQVLLMHGLELRVALQVRLRLFEALAAARWPALALTRTSDLLHGLTTEATRVGYAVSYLLSMLVQGLLVLVYLGLALRVSAGVTVVAMGTGLLLVLALRRQRRSARQAGVGVSTLTGEMVSAATEHLQAMKVVKSYGAQDRDARRFAEKASGSLEMHMRAWRAVADARGWFLFGSVVLLALVAYTALEVLGVPTGAVLLLVFLFYRLVPRLGNLQNVYQNLIHDLPAYANLEARIRALEAEREEIAGEARHTPLREGVRFEGVSFGYQAGGVDAVRGLDLEIPSRHTVALVGPSGAGKTTVADLLLGLVRPREGRIVVDGRTLSEDWLREWRDGIGYVAQETVLFHETVRANLLWASPGADEAALREALRQAAALPFVDALPQGLDTVVGDRGVRLSGGERQRLALARALLRRPALLVLDEATSALDTENERRIREAVRELHGRTTIVLITHRLSSVRDADVIHVLEGGQRVESGTWDALMARPDGRFRRLWQSQEDEAEGAEAPGQAAAEPSPAMGTAALPGSTAPDGGP